MRKELNKILLERLQRLLDGKAEWTNSRREAWTGTLD